LSSRYFYEKPFASTVEGGFGANIKGVPKAEQSVQGGTMRGFYNKYKMKSGDKFNVAIIP